MKGTVTFAYDRANDVVVATPRWHLETEADVLACYRRYESYLKIFTRKMDLIVVLDDFTISPTIGVVWGEYRARLYKHYTRFTYRVRSNGRVKLFVNASGVQHEVATEEATTVEDAIEEIAAARRTTNVAKWPR